MVEISIADPEQHQAAIRGLFTEYLTWGNARLREEFKVEFDTTAMVDGDMQTLDKFMPPKGRLLLAYAEGQPVGLACLKELTPDIGEVKRMYVRPAARRHGLGRALLDRLLAEARAIGYERVRLDSARFMAAAHRLYRAAGFREIKPYAGSEIFEFREHWVFMELVLVPA
jgi:ribosomal protein S18 acetylase RimI-like enzyme